MKQRPFATYKQRRKYESVCRSPAGWTPEMERVYKQCDLLRFAVNGRQRQNRLSPEDKAFRLRWKLKTVASVALLFLTSCKESPPSYTFAYVKQNISQDAVVNKLTK